MEYAIGIVLALVVSALAALVGFDRDRAFCPTLVVIASYYVLFAEMSGSAQAMLVESVGMTAFAALAVLGFRGNLWIVVAAGTGSSIRSSDPWTPATARVRLLTTDSALKRASDCWPWSYWHHATHARVHYREAESGRPRRGR